MFEQRCAVCRQEIAADCEIYLMDEHGFTHHYCPDCGHEAKKRLRERDGDIRGR